ncbi:MAG: hypothetical protein IJO93_01820 [Clostridia bacterium]|nr:hypothetical protein [Clostridia bacterium]
MKRVLFVIMLFLCAGLLFSCSNKTIEPDEMALHELKNMYMGASVIAYAECEGFAENDVYAVLTVKQTLFGNASVQSSVYCEKGNLLHGETYLLFLYGGRSVDKKRFDLSAYSAMKSEGDILIWNGHRYLRTSIEAKLSGYNSIVFMPPHTYFYGNIKELVKDSSDIIIGKPETSLKRSKHNVYSRTDAASIQNVLNVVRTEVKVVGCLKGELANDDRIEVLYIPELLSSMTDTQTLSTVSMKEKDMIMPEVGQYYVFFLKKGTDAKQELYLPVNPIQGWLGLENDMLRAAEENKLFSSCPDLKELVRELNKA